MIRGINILKLLIFLFIFIVISFLIIFIFIVPDIKNLRNAKIEHKRTYNIYIFNKNKLNSKIKDLKNLKYNNLKIIQAFDNKFNEKDFIKFAKKYFKDATLKKEATKPYKQNFIKYSFNTVSKITTPTVFYKFLTDINRYDNIIQADFPIHMQAVGNDINTTFNLKVFVLKKR